MPEVIDPLQQSLLNLRFNASLALSKITIMTDTYIIVEAVK